MSRYTYFKMQFLCKIFAVKHLYAIFSLQLKAFFMDRLKSEKTTQTAILAMETLNKAIEVDKGYKSRLFQK